MGEGGGGVGEKKGITYTQPYAVTKGMISALNRGSDERHSLNPFTTRACKISGLNVARTRPAKSIFSGPIISIFSAMPFDQNYFTCQCKIQISHICGSEGVNASFTVRGTLTRLCPQSTHFELNPRRPLTGLTNASPLGHPGSQSLGGTLRVDL